MCFVFGLVYLILEVECRERDCRSHPHLILVLIVELYKASILYIDTYGMGPMPLES